MTARLHREFLDLAAARLDERLAPADEHRLEAHLATCDACRGRVAGYEADRAALRVLRELLPPPRDLWARTAAALDREQARSTGWRATLGRPWTTVRRLRPRTRGALAAALSLIVIVAVVGSGLVPGFPGGGPNGVAQSTPFSVEPKILAYVSNRNGDVGVYMGQIDRVCPETTSSTCLPIEADVRKVASFASDFVPQQLTVSPDGRIGAVVGTSGTGGAVYAVRFPELVRPTPIPTATSTSTSTSTSTVSASTSSPAVSSPTPSASPTVETATLEATPGPQPEAIIEHVVVVGETPAYSNDGTMLAFSAMPSDRSRGPDIYVWHVGSEAAVAVTSDHGSIFASWVGGDIVGSRAGASAHGGDVAPGSVTPASFLLDPATKKASALARPAWRPIVDPTGRFVAYWDGTLVGAPDGLTWQEDRGGLYLAPWALFAPGATGPGAAPTPTSPGATATPTATPHGGRTTEPSAAAPDLASPAPTDTSSPATTAQPSAKLSTEPPTEPPAEASASPGASPSQRPSPLEPAVTTTAPQPLETGRDYTTDPILSWEVRWSPDGAWFGAWVGEAKRGGRPATAPEPGNLTVGAVDRLTGQIERERILDRAPAVRGFALGDHRIAWATLPGTDGKSEVRLLVWSDKGRGTVNTSPGGGNNTLPAL